MHSVHEKSGKKASTLSHKSPPSSSSSSPCTSASSKTCSPCWSSCDCFCFVLSESDTVSRMEVRMLHVGSRLITSTYEDSVYALRIQLKRRCSCWKKSCHIQNNPHTFIKKMIHQRLSNAKKISSHTGICSNSGSARRASVLRRTRNEAAPISKERSV